jgi:hypothetical protein
MRHARRGDGVDISGSGPCPCTCICLPFGWIGSLFSTISGFVTDLRRLFQRDTTLFGIPAPWSATPLVGTPDSWVEQVLLDSRMDAPITYGLPAGTAPGAETLLAGAAPSSHIALPLAPRSRSLILAAGMTEVWEPATSALLPVPVGPGPGIPGVGTEPLYPVNGVRFAASPGSLPAGIAPAANGHGLGELGERLYRATADGAPQ